MGTRNLVTLALVFLGGLVAGGAVFYFASPYLSRGRSSARRAATEAPVTSVSARGRLEPAGGIVNLAAAGADILKTIKVKEGAEIKENDVLAILASHDLRKTEAEAAAIQLREAEERRKYTLAHMQAQQREADAKIRQLEEQGPTDISVQESKLKVLEQQYATAESLVARMRRAGGYPAAEVEQAELRRVQAEQELRSARTLLTKLNEAHQLNLQSARAQREASEAGMRRAESEAALGSLQKNVQLTGQRLEQSLIRSPVNGRVLKVMAREGEMVGAQPVFQVADTSVMVCVAEVYETDVKAVRDWFRGSERVEADVEVHYLGGSGGAKFSGRVVSVGTLMGKNTAFSLDPRQDVDRRVVEVRIQLDGKHHAEAAEFLNMIVDVTIHDPKSRSK